MISALALLLAAQSAPPIARTDSAPPPVVTGSAHQPGIAVSNSPPPIVAVTPGPPFPVHVPGTVVDATGPAPLPPGVTIVRAPQPRTKLQQLVSEADYPASALARGEAGRVAFLLDVGENGRVTGCTITSSSGSAALDSTTCRLMRSRARFTPTADSNGMSRAGRVADELIWTLPGADGEGG